MYDLERCRWPFAAEVLRRQHARGRRISAQGVRLGVAQRTALVRLVCVVKQILVEDG
jgi:hypothetical protein